MADENQVKLLKRQGVEAWNKWRDDNPTISIDLSKADFEQADLHGANFRGDYEFLAKDGLRTATAKLWRTNFCSAKLVGASFRGAKLNGAYLRSANLEGADFSRADLHTADLSGASVICTNFSEARLFDTDFYLCFMRAAQLGTVDLSHSRNLETINHSGPSAIGIDTIYRSGANIPEFFLRGAGVPETFITHMKSLVAAMSPIEFYSCFISYSSKDQELAERLYADLQSKKVRCWFAPEDLKIGAKLRPSFDEAIRVHDKLMVLLSENSVSSEWVEKEVETAFEKERRDPEKNKRVLFPIMLDDAVMETNEAWAADIRRTRHIGDFRGWKNHDSYKKAFEKLLRALKA